MHQRRRSLLPSLAALSVLLGALPGASPAQQPMPGALRLSRVVGDHMVMQRDAAVPVWGWAAPGDQVSVTFDGRTHNARADARGAWMVELPPRSAGGPYEMTVADGSQRLQLRDILVGDLWVCSGQSNMEFTLANARNGAAEVAAASDSRIRHFKVPNSYAEQPEDELAGGEWQVADPAHAGGFTAVGWFFARDLRKTVDVPIGLLHTSWGGSRVETWMSRQALKMSEAQWAEAMRREREYEQLLLDSLRARIATGPGGQLPAVDGGLVEGRALWADPALDDSAWATIEVPKLWEQQGYPEMDGTAWYRTTFTLSEQEARAGAVRLGLGTIDDDDITWVNGVEVGRTQGYNRPRVYDVPASALRAGANVLAVRVQDGGGGGGFYGDPALIYLEAGGARRPLGGPWRFRVGAVVTGADGQHINKIPTLLYNKMVHPLLPLPIKGVLWYQGESNADRYEDAVAYRGLFADLITSWRREWAGGRQGNFPFLWVQLANYMAPDTQPAARSNWAALRESQSAALALPNTGQAVIIDVGETEDIHPKDKQDVGARLALAARRVAYGDRGVVASGPIYKSHRVRGGRVVVEFDPDTGPLRAPARGGVLRGFAIAGADRKFVWANAAIEHGRVVVWSDQVKAPIAVRYAWGNNPLEANLYNGAGLPAAPFRTDRW